MIEITTGDLISLLLEIEHIEAALEYQTGFNSYDYFLNEVLKMNNEQVLNCLIMDHDSQIQSELLHNLIHFVSEYFNIQYQYDSTTERK